jgi:putative hemolysin
MRRNTVQVLSALQQYTIPSAVPSAVPDTAVEDSRYLVRFALNVAELEAALKLRFEVFNLELGEGLDSSFLTGRDRDEFDATCLHLIVIEKERDEIVGTYRVRTMEMAETRDGFYSAGEFDLSALPDEVLHRSVELGRACIARQHRDKRVLFLMWKALTRYTLDHRKRYLFGCCSLTSQEPLEGQKLLSQLSSRGYMHPRLWVNPKRGLECGLSDVGTWPGNVKLPRLFKTYLSIGAKVCGPPAIDRQFKTIDFFVICDLYSMNERTRKMLF